MKNYILFIITLIGFQTSFAQDLLTKQAPLPCLNKHFSIVAHIVKLGSGSDDTGVKISDIEKAIKKMNVNFEPICVSFDICKFDTIDNFLYDNLSDLDWTEMKTQFNEDRRINMYFVSATAEEGVCGFAQLNGINTYDDGGIVILKEQCLTPNVVTHEMGHYFNLLHTFEENGVELVNGSNCNTQGDKVCDTPADPFDPSDTMTEWVDENCVFIDATHLDANGEYYRPDVGNIMSYYDCKCGFTHGQYLRMAKAAESSETW